MGLEKRITEEVELVEDVVMEKEKKKPRRKKGKDQKASD